MYSGDMLPQADVLSDVLKVAEAVRDGNVTFQDIGKYLGKGERQGRYYRLAAESISLIVNIPGQNLSQLIALGEEYIASPAPEREAVAKRAVLTNPVVRDALAFIEDAGAVGRTEHELANYVTTAVSIGSVTADRRVTTLRSWLEATGLISFQDGVTRAVHTASWVLVNDVDASPTSSITPLLKPINATRTPEERFPLPMPSIQYIVDAVKFERARRGHQRLVESMAAKIVARGGIPQSNRYVDLAATIRLESYLFEMKTATHASFRSQIRRAISQLYEYRYLQQLPDAHLVLMLDRRPSDNEMWLVYYLENDRKIWCCWMKEDGKFGCGAASAPHIGDLIT